MRWLDSVMDSRDMNLRKLQDIAQERGASHAIFMGSQRVGRDLATEQQQ